MTQTPEKSVERPPVNPSPKFRFLTTEIFLNQHRALIDRPETQRAIDFALLEYQRILCEQNSDANAAAGNHFKVKGALEFVNVLKNLSETPNRVPVIVPANLDHSV